MSYLEGKIVKEVLRRRSTMSNQDWHVTNNSECIKPSPEVLVPEPIVPYRLYRFLTDLEEILLRDTDDGIRLQKISPLVRHLLDNSPWIELQFLPPDPETGWSVTMLYDEPDYPLTIQLVSWMPGMVSPIHNHAAWGLVAILSGQEKNTFWRRSPQTGSLEPAGDRILSPGDVITFMPDAIHQVEALGNEPVISFNLYGETEFDRRFEYDPETGAAQLF